MAEPTLIPPPIRASAPFQELVDLASERVGGAALLANDEFFAEKENLLRPHAPVWKEGVYTDRGKWMDGWESRRRRVAGHDWCIIKLGLPGVIRGFDVDTAYFRGNYPEQCSIEACAADGNPAPEELGEGPQRVREPAGLPATGGSGELAGEATRWTELLPRTDLQGHSQNLFPVADERRWTHLKLHIYPDGGVARLRVHGEVRPDWRRLARPGVEIDLAAVENGASVIVCNDAFFGSRHNLIMPGRAVNMGDGWETRRKRRPKLWEDEANPPRDWTIVRLGAQGSLRRVEVDTNHFKGNFPESCELEGTDDDAGTVESLTAPGRKWTLVLPRTKLRAHTRHFYEEEQLAAKGPFTHLRLSMFPDGGISRLRVHGVVTPGAPERRALGRLHALPAAAAEATFWTCCGSKRWAAGMAAARPFASAAAVHEAADRLWAQASREDILEAFAAHPRIGSKKDVEKQGAATKRLAEGEQAGASGASSDTLAALATGNQAYEARFGHIYIVCATGKSADEMLGILKSRLGNEPDKELGVAAEEQRKITRIRLDKLLERTGT